MKHIDTPILPADCDIALLGDFHFGTVFAHRDGVKSVLDWVLAAPNRYWVCMGDAIEAITTDDRRYQSPGSTEPIPMIQAKDAIEFFRPVAARGLAWLQGNHEHTLARVGDLAEMMADGLGVPYATWSCKLTLRGEGGPMCRFYLRHNTRSRLVSNAKDYEQRVANMKAGLKRDLQQHAADCALMAAGHTHKLLTVEPSPRLYLSSTAGGKMKQGYLSGNGGMAQYIEPDCRWYANTGSFLRQYVEGISGYAERAGYDPVELGYVVAGIRGGKLAEVRAVRV